MAQGWQGVKQKEPSQQISITLYVKKWQQDIRQCALTSNLFFYFQDIASGEPEPRNASPQPPRLPARLLRATTSRSADADDGPVDVTDFRLLPPPLPPKHHQSKLAPLAQLNEDDPFAADQNLDWWALCDVINSIWRHLRDQVLGLLRITWVWIPGFN